jgi:hypothetical protein
MTIDEEGRALLIQYAEDFARLRKAADAAGDIGAVAIHDAQLDLILHLIAVLATDP